MKLDATITLFLLLLMQQTYLMYWVGQLSVWKCGSRCERRTIHAIELTPRSSKMKMANVMCRNRGRHLEKSR
eukprot:4932698-Amphidinium_carterae.1